MGIQGLDDDAAEADGDGDGNDKEEDNKDNEYDIAHDTFLLSGERMSGYCQMFKQKERPSEDTIDWTGWNADEVKDFLIDLNGKFILEWLKEFVNKSSGIDFLGWAICGKDYDEYNKAKEILDKEELAEKSGDIIKQKVDERLSLREMEI